MYCYRSRDYQLAELWQLSRFQPQLVKLRSTLDELTQPMKPKRNANIKRQAVEQAAYLLALADIRPTTSANGKFVRLAEAVSGQRGGFRHHCADFLRAPVRFT